MLEALTQATTANMAAHRQKIQTFVQITQEAVDRRAQSVATLIGSMPSGERIASQGLASRGGRIDITV